MAEELGKTIVANIVMLGALAALGEVVTYDSVKESVLSSIPAGTEDLNLSAFNKGFEYGRRLLHPEETKPSRAKPVKPEPEKREKHI
jgi:2-oxoglutarate ferredoxin oxidoreductase subunit gamma